MDHSVREDNFLKLRTIKIKCIIIFKVKNIIETIAHMSLNRKTQGNIFRSNKLQVK